MRKLLLLFLFLMTFGLMSAQQEVAFDFTKLYGTATISDISTQSQTVDGVTISFAKGNSSTAPAYNKVGEVRLYGGKSATVLDGNTMTITSTTGNITAISLTAGSSCTWGTLSADNGEISVDDSHNATWTGESSSVTITLSRNSSATSTSTQYRITDATITLASEDPEAVAAPIITLGDNNMVSLSQADGADIYYTTDGNTPSATGSTKYTGPFAITTTTTIKAIAVLNGKESLPTTKELKPNTVSNIAEFLDLQNTDDTKINTPLTAIYQCGRNLYLTDGNDFILAYNNNNNADVTALAAQNGDVISFITGTYKSQNGLPELIPSAIGSKSTGTAVEPEELTIEEIPADRLNKYVKITDVNIVAAASDNNYNATDETGSIVLYNTFNSATNYPNAITLPDGTTGNTIPEGEGFTVYGFVSVYTNAQGSTLQITPIKIEGGTVMETVATPVFTPASGSELNNGDQITIECATEGARIFVAFDDEIPTAESMEYTEPLTFSENCKINAIAIKDGMLDSDVATASYTLYIEGSETATFDFTESGNIASLQTDNTFIAPESGKGVSINDINFQNGSILLSIGKGTNTSNTAQWWNYAGTNRGLECRIYTGNEMNISLVEDGYKITKITFEQNSGSTTWGNMTVTTNLGAAGTTSTSVGGVWTNNTKTYEAPASGEVNFISFTPNANSRFAKMTVEYVVDENGVQGIEDVINDNADAPVEYYNLQGIRVNGDNLTPGIYVRRQGNEVAKVLVK